MVELKNVSKYFNNNKTVSIGLNNISLKLPNTGLFIISGDNGSGKSTLLNVLAGLYDYDCGDYYYNGKDILEDSNLKNQVYSDYAMINQDNRLFESLTVYENLELVKNDSSDFDDKIDKYLTFFNILHLKNEKVSNISGGEQKCVAITRALLLDKKILLCDEITANLDKNSETNLYRMLKTLSSECLILVVTHNMKIVEPLSDGKIVLENGEILESTIDINESPKVKMISNSNKLISSKRLICKSMKLINKSVLLSCIYAILVIGILSLTTYFSYADIKYRHNHVAETYFSNNDPLRIIVDNVNENIVENEALKNVLSTHKYVYNDYILEYDFKITDENLIDTQSLFYNDYDFNFSPVIGYDYEILYGNLPQKNNEVFMLGNFSDLDRDKNYNVDKMLNTTFVFGNEKLTISGIGQSKNGIGNLNLNSCVLYSENILSLLDVVSTSPLEVKNSFGEDFAEIYIDDTLKDNTIYVSDLATLDKVYYNSINIDMSIFTIVEKANPLYEKEVIGINRNTYKSILDSIKVRLNIYLNNIDEKEEVIDLLKDYNVIVPFDYSYHIDSSSNAYDRYVNIIIGLCIGGVLVYVLLRLFMINQSKKQLSKLLMLGISKKKILGVISIGLLFEGISSFSITIITSIVCKMILPSLNEMIFISSISALLVFIDIIYYYIMSKKTINSLYLSEVK